MVDYLNLYERMHDNNIMLAFKGEVSFDLVNSILKIMEDRLDKVEEDRKTKKKVYNVLVECLQNLCHHLDSVDFEYVGDMVDGKTALLLIESNKNGYQVVTGNYVTNERIDSLKERLDEINSVSKEELRDLYKRILNNDRFSDKGGAGLGFIDIARKSGQKLNYNFQSVNDKVSFFSLLINIYKS